MARAAAGAGEPDTSFDPDTARAQLEDVERRALLGQVERRVIAEAITRAGEIEAAASRCAEDAEQKLGQVRRTLDAIETTRDPKSNGASGAAKGGAMLERLLEKAPGGGQGKFASEVPASGDSRSQAEAATQPDMPADVAAELDDVAGRESALEILRTECLLVAGRSERLIEKLSSLRKERLRVRLSQRGADLAGVLTRLAQQAAPDWGAFTGDLAARVGLERWPELRRWLAGALTVSGLVAGVWLARRLRARPATRTEDPSRQRAVALTAAASLPWLLAAAVPAVYLGLEVWLADRPAYVAVLGAILFTVALSVTASRCVLAPGGDPRGRRLVELLARPIRRRVWATAIVTAGLMAVVHLPEGSPQLLPYLWSLRALLAILLLGCGLNLIGVLSRLPRARGGWFRLARLAVAIVLLAIAGAELLGYRNLVAYLLGGLAGTVLLIALCTAASRLIAGLLDGLDAPRFAWQRKLRRNLGLRPREPVPGLVWAKILSIVVLWTVFVVLALTLWGLSASGFDLLLRYFTSGFELAGIRLVPYRILLALLSLALLLAAVRWGKHRMQSRWIRRTSLDPGAQEAIVTIAGYLAITVALLISLSLAGVELANLALIAGALSIGIGFGLQNIVNNFVSGLILLIERPIRTGDWVVVGSTEGHVKRIRVRSTQIQTFDRSDVVVPNSELIASQVINWTLTDSYGRLTLKVGVAYDSDVERVEAVLMEVANGCSQVLTDSQVRGPQVLFRGFGDSALNFELRVYVEDMNDIWEVESALYFAIFRAFREAGITIPFPQTELHVRSLPEAAFVPAADGQHTSASSSVDGKPSQSG